MFDHVECFQLSRYHKTLMFCPIDVAEGSIPVQSAMFAKLQTELLCIILSQLDSLQDLYSFIYTSTATYEAFQGARYIMTAIIRNIIRPEALPDARFALQAPSPIPQIPASDMSLAEVEQLCIFWHSHDYFIKDFIASFETDLNVQVRVKLRETDKTSSIVLSKGSLSLLELTQVQRAILRYSAFSRRISESKAEYRPNTFR